MVNLRCYCYICLTQKLKCACFFVFFFCMAYAAAPLYPASFESTISDLIICACI